MAARAIALVLGYAFLYLPLITVVIYSFNASRMVTVWGGFSLHWYGALLHNEQMLSAAALSLRIGALSATGATVLGTCAALLVTRAARGAMRTFVAGSIAALLVIPEVILGFGLLLTFVTLEHTFGWPAGRSASTITIAHITLSLAYVSVIVRSRLVALDPAIEEAARDLGATPWRVLWTITLPMLAPALAAGWLLAFTLSLDDLVIASFAAGPGSTTLPMVVYGSVRLGVSPQINALATVLVGVVTLGIAAATWVMARQNRRLT